MARLLKDNSGFALLVTIFIISVIVALSLHLNISIRADLHSAANFRDSVELTCIAKSGFNCAVALLFEDASESDVDSLNEAWAYSKGISSDSAALFDEGWFVLDIIDLTGRIQVNQLIDEDGKYDTKQKALMTGLLNSDQFGLNSEQAENIIDAIKDWIDPDNEITRFAAESTYYQSLEKPYACRNAPLEYLDELLLVKGITNDLFYGQDNKPGISHYLTVYGQGKININTADTLILNALSDDIDQEMAHNMAEYRSDEDNDLKDPKWYQNITGMGHVIIDSDTINTHSTHFMIVSEAFKAKINKRVTGILERKEGTIKILSWKTE